MTDEDKICENCKYFDEELRDPMGPTGVCTRFPKEVRKFPDRSCGEWESGGSTHKSLSKLREEQEPKLDKHNYNRVRQLEYKVEEIGSEYQLVVDRNHQLEHLLKKVIADATGSVDMRCSDVSHIKRNDEGTRVWPIRMGLYREIKRALR